MRSDYCKACTSPSHCPYCSMALHTLGSKGLHGTSTWNDGNTLARLLVCNSCGWWLVVAQRLKQQCVSDYRIENYSADGELRVLDTSDISVPVHELQRYLITHYSDRFALNPRRYEEIVGGVFREFGYRVRMTAISCDEGIDLFVMDGDASDEVGVQVKRWRAAIEAEPIRAFAGALVLNGVTKGIYVTTSRFTRGAVSTARRLFTRGLAVELWDATTFYEKLRLSTRPAYRDPEDTSAPFAKFWGAPLTLPLIHSEEGAGP